MGEDYTLDRGGGCSGKKYCRKSFCKFLVAWGGLGCFFVCIVVGIVLASTGNKCGAALAGATALAAGAAKGGGPRRGRLLLFDHRPLTAANTTDTGGMSAADAVCVSMFILSGLGMIAFMSPACCRCRGFFRFSVRLFIRWHNANGEVVNQ